MNERTIIGTVPAAKALHQVPGFDPMKYLRRTVNDKGEPVKCLGLSYQKLWFRMACPKGRMQLNPLRLTDQLAIYEAKVFFDMDDTGPASTYTAKKSATETHNYIRAAQEEALKEALDNAGFGIQLVDVTQVSHSSDGDVRPEPFVQSCAVEEVADQPTPVSVKDTSPSEFATPSPTKDSAEAVSMVQIQETAVAATAEQDRVSPPVSNVSVITPVKTVVPAGETLTVQQDTAAQDTASMDEPSLEDGSTSEGRQSVLTLLNIPTHVEEGAVSEEAISEAAGQQEDPSPVEPVYTDDTPVAEILRHMTLDAARAVVVTSGTCKDWTMAKVAEKRRASLRFFTNDFCTCGNIQKVAATLLLQELEQKAG